MKIYLITKNARPTQSQLDKFKTLGNFEWIDAIKLTAQEVVNKAEDAEIKSFDTVIMNIEGFLEGKLINLVT